MRYIGAQSSGESALIPADNASGNFTKVVQRIPVYITLNSDNRHLAKLRAGMSVQVKIDTESLPVEEGIAVIKLLSAAQNHRPIFVVMAVFTGAILSTLFVRMFSISLADLRGVFGLDVAQGSWLNVALNIAQLISMTLVPWFMVVYGAEKY